MLNTVRVVWFRNEVGGDTISGTEDAGSGALDAARDTSDARSGDTHSADARREEYDPLLPGRQGHVRRRRSTGTHRAVICCWRVSIVYRFSLVVS